MTSRVIRYSIFPLTLFIVQHRLPVALRDFDTQSKLGRTAFDLRLHNGLVLPSTGDTFQGPNGAPLRPVGVNMNNLIRDFRGEPLIFSILSGTAAPEGFVLLHEHSDQFSLQVARPMPLPEMNERITAFLKTVPQVTRDNYLAALDDPDNFDN